MAVVILVAQQLDSMFVTPLVYQKTVNLHPIVTLTSVIVGSQLLGIVGAFLAVPMVAVGWAVYNALEQPGPKPAGPADSGLDGPKFLTETRRTSVSAKITPSHDELEAMLMLRQMTDMPVGTIGFEAVGEVEDDDWEDTVEPVLGAEIAQGRKVRLLYLLGPGTREVEGDAMKADTEFRARHAQSFDRVAVVSDEDWMRPALSALSFLLPGKAKGFRVSDLTDAKAWLAADSD